MPYLGKVVTSVPVLPHYVNPNSNISVTLTEYNDSLSVDSVIGTIKYTDKRDEEPDEIKTGTLVCSYVGSSSNFDFAPDGIYNMIIRVTINHVQSSCVISVENWNGYDSTEDFDRFVIHSVDLDW